MPRRKNHYEVPTYFTTYQVAKHLGVSLPTVVNWVNSGLLPAHRTPGGHRRISRNDVIAFARANSYPISREILETGNGRRKVLVVDDQRDFSEMVRDYLSMRGGFEVEVADSGFQAGLIVARFKPDLILMDIQMPDMDGFQACRMLRADPETRHIPVVACTAYRDAQVDQRLEQEQFHGIVEKPLKLDQLLDMVRRHLGDALPAPA